MSYFRPLRLPNGRPRYRKMADYGDLILPLYLWHNILMFVAADDLLATLNCRSVCRIFRNLIDDYNTYGVIDMGNNMYLPQQDPLNPQHADPRLIFYRHCLEANNPEALFREGMCTLKISGNVPLCMHYLQMASMGNRMFGCKGGTRIDYHPLALYVLTMFYIIRGPNRERRIFIRDMSIRLHHISSGWNLHGCRHMAHTWMNNLGNVHTNLLNHIPMRSNAFLPPGSCERCGESRYLRVQDNKDMDMVNGDRTLGPCCDTCVCYMEAVSFFGVLRGLWRPM